MIAETEFFDVCAVCRDRFSADIRKAEKEHKERAREIEQNYKGALAKEENIKNKARLADAKEKAAEKAKKAILEAYEKEEIRQKAGVSCITVAVEKVQALDSLRGVPMNKEELAAIADSIGNSGYWVAAKLRQLAEENGVLSLPGLPPTYTEKMEALNTAKERLLEYIETGAPEELNFDITDKALRMLESDFSGGFKNYKISPEKQAALLTDKAKAAGDMFSAAVFVRNALETAAPEVRAELARLVSVDNSYWNNVREIGGLSSILDGMKKKETADEKAALAYVADARLAGEVAKLTEAERSAALYGSSIVPENTGNNRKIDRQGLDFLTTEEGAAMVKQFDRSLKKAEEAARDKAAEAEKRAEIENN